MTFKLKRLRQCKKCPWRVDTDPHDIPNGYSVDKHEGLANSIADRDNPLRTYYSQAPMVNMACHEMHNAHCIGWLHNQLGEGNNIKLRLIMRECENINRIQIIGEQHPDFESTLPKNREKRNEE